jgi:putative hydrolase of the HAD superfamily
LAALRVVVWDVDDTLYLERSYARSGFRAVGAHLEAAHGVEGFNAHAWEAFERGVRGTIFNVALETVGVEATGTMVRELVDIYRRHVPDITLLPDAKAAIEEVRELGLGMAVITDGPLSSQRAKVLALDLEAFAQPVICTAALGAGFSKPHPRAFEMVAEHWGARGGELVYVADNPHKDFKAPRELGWHSIRLRRPGGLHREVESQGDVDVELRDMGELMDALSAFGDGH